MRSPCAWGSCAEVLGKYCPCPSAPLHICLRTLISIVRQCCSSVEARCGGLILAVPDHQSHWAAVVRAGGEAEPAAALLDDDAGEDDAAPGTPAPPEATRASPSSVVLPGGTVIQSTARASVSLQTRALGVTFTLSQITSVACASMNPCAECSLCKQEGTRRRVGGLRRRRPRPCRRRKPARSCPCLWWGPPRRHCSQTALSLQDRLYVVEVQSAH